MDFWSGLFEGVPGEAFLEHTGCPACGRSEARTLSRLGPTFLKRCAACALVYSSPRLSAAMREAMYRLNPGALTPELDGILARLMAERVGNMRREMFPIAGGETSPVGGSLFEVGSGWGHFLQACRPHFRAVAGAELSREQAAHSRSRFGLEISEGDIFADGTPRGYDVIAAWELLEHLPDPRGFLAWAHARLRPGGQLALSTPNYASLYRRLLGSHWFYFIPSQHLTYFSPRTLAALMREVGFAEVRVRTSGRSLFRERWNDHNRVDGNLDARGQWLQALRIRESIERERDATSLDRSGLARRIWHGLVWRLIHPLVTHGLGDQMRVYARKGAS
jgi:2-polyprenyl-3-methyl-5-hydroxy-6-metoxy-1,4-benzoquinol methylase